MPEQPWTDQLQGIANQIDRIASDMPSPNEYTPQLRTIANGAMLLALKGEQDRRTRPGEATPQKQEGPVYSKAGMLNYAEYMATESRDEIFLTDFDRRMLAQIRDFIARADLPGEGMKSPAEWVEFFSNNPVMKDGAFSSQIDSEKMIEMVLADARRGGPEPEKVGLEQWLIQAVNEASFQATYHADKGESSLKYEMLLYIQSFLFPKPADIK